MVSMLQASDSRGSSERFSHFTFLHHPCKCRAPRLHRVFEFYWVNPSASRKDAARSLRMTETNVWGALHRLRLRNPSRYCPDCFSPKLLNGVCESCGFEPSAPLLFDSLPGSQSPTNWIHPGNMLGTEVDYKSIGFQNHWAILKRRIDRGVEDNLVRSVKSDVENELKRAYPGEAITDEAGRLVFKEVLEFRARYPDLALSKNLHSQLAQNVINRIRLLHPHLRHLTTLPTGILL
jgi:hypothetical protein